MGKRGRAMGLCTSKDNDAIGGVATPAQVAYFAHLSKIAYEPRKVDLDSNVRCVDSAEHGYRLYVYKNKHITVVCRGTQSNTDILDDLNAQTSACDISGLQLHAGFHERATAVFNDLPLQIDAATLGSCSIDITGHSLGGAIAVVLGILMKIAGHKIRRIVTFGQPRVLKEGCTHPTLHCSVLSTTRIWCLVFRQSQLALNTSSGKD